MKELKLRRSKPRRKPVTPKLVYQPLPTPKPVYSPPPPVSGSCMDWIKGAGISDINSAIQLINKESGCNPNAVNPSSGACGVAQELPCGKSGCALGDGACQVKWMDGYVQARYGSWANALAFQIANSWY